MTGTCSIDGGPAIACDMRTDLKNLVVEKNTMLSATGLGNNQFECKRYQKSISVSLDTSLKKLYQSFG
ncbi:EC29 protein [Colletotrichum asianum]